MTVSGQLTLSSTGVNTFDIGIAAEEIDFYGGARPSTTETSELLSVGHADENNQFVYASGGGKSTYRTDRCIRVYNASGTIVVDASFTEMDGTDLVLNVITANAAYPIQISARA